MPRVKAGPIQGMKPGSAITKVVRDAADRLYDAFLRDSRPNKCGCSVCRGCCNFVRIRGKRCKIDQRQPDAIGAVSVHVSEPDTFAPCAKHALSCEACVARKYAVGHARRMGHFERAYAQFVETTSKEFVKMATKIFRMWSLPEAIEPEDVMQDLHLEIVRIMRSYNPTKATVAAFLIWNAFARAKKECNRQRGKCKDRDKQSMHALVISNFLMMGESGPERFEDCIDRLAVENDAIELDRECESMLDGKNILRRVREQLSEQDSRYIYRIALNGGNVRQTAFNMISAVDEMTTAKRERAVKRKTKKLMIAVRNASTVWSQLKKQEQDNGEKERRQEGEIDRGCDGGERSGNASDNEERRIDERREVARNAIGEAIRHRRSEARFRAARKERSGNRRNAERTSGSALWFLCA